MAIDRIRALTKDDFDAVNNLIVTKIQSQISLIDSLSKHIVESGGKRLRPLLVLLASRACGYEGSDHILLAAAIEFIHTATLLHDDVVDESTLRRGRETANSIWGSKASILVGDFLFTQSTQLTVEVGNFDVIQLITDTTFKICCGEVKQLSNKHNPALSFEEYFEVIQAKTALLFAASACIGAHLSGSDSDTKAKLYQYGLHLGNAFQLIDDALDYCSDAKTLGKNIGDDLADGKATLPLIHALKHGSEEQQFQIRESLKLGTLDYLPQVLEAINSTHSIEYTKEVAASEVALAKSALINLPDSPYKEAMLELADFAIQRSF